MNSSTKWLFFVVFISVLWGSWSYSIGVALFITGIIAGGQIGDYWANYKRCKKAEKFDGWDDKPMDPGTRL